MLVNVIVIGLATFALTFLLKDTAGPFDIFSSVRERLTLEHQVRAEGAPAYHTEPVHPFWFNWYACFWCMSTWTSAGLSLLYVIAFGLPWFAWFFIWLAAIALAGTIYTLLP